jgi:hypothetical protein
MSLGILTRYLFRLLLGRPPIPWQEYGAPPLSRSDGRSHHIFWSFSAAQTGLQEIHAVFGTGPPAVQVLPWPMDRKRAVWGGVCNRRVGGDAKCFLQVVEVSA